MLKEADSHTVMIAPWKMSKRPVCEKVDRAEFVKLETSRYS
jgi:hypothetical protein